MDQTVDIERAFLARVFYRRGGKKIQEQFVIAKSNGIKAEHFFDPESRLVWEAAEQLFSEPGFDELTIFEIVYRANLNASKSKSREIQSLNVTKAFFDIAEKPIDGAETLERFCCLIKDHYLYRKFSGMADKFKASLVGGVSPADSLASFVSECQDDLISQSKTSVISGGLVNDIIESYKTAHHHVSVLGESDYTPGIPMPWRRLSYAMNGFEPALCILAARPGVGKTSMAVNMMRFWMDIGLKVVFNSLDMSGQELFRRQISEYSRVSSRKMKFGKSEEDVYKKDIAAVENAANKLTEMINDGRYLPMAEYNIDRLKATCKILKDQGKIDVLVVDYIQQMTYDGSERIGDVQKITRISQMLHSMTIELGIPVLALSQLNRSNDKDERPPRLSDLRGSGAIEQDASYVILLYRDNAVKKLWDDPQTAPVQYLADKSKTEALRSYMPIWVHLAKSRDGDADQIIPFVVVQNKYAWYQADYEADDKYANFARVWDDWRHDPIEKVWERNGALIRSAVKVDIAATNGRIASSQVNARTTSQEPSSGEPTGPGVVTDDPDIGFPEDAGEIESIF